VNRSFYRENDCFHFNKPFFFQVINCVVWICRRAEEAAWKSVLCLVQNRSVTPSLGRIRRFCQDQSSNTFLTAGWKIYFGFRLFSPCLPPAILTVFTAIARTGRTSGIEAATWNANLSNLIGLYKERWSPVRSSHPGEFLQRRIFDHEHEHEKERTTDS
jgi:hypothetical protein